LQFFEFAGVHNEHLEAVFDVGEAGVGVVVKGEDLNVGVFFFEAFYDSASADVVGQAPEGLEYDEGVYAVRSVVEDFAGNEPAFA
jgi:hypothetical protein